MPWLFSGSPDQASCCQRMVPLRRSRQSTTRFLPLSSAEVRKIRSPQMIGEDWPLPGSGVFHTTDLASQRTGKLNSEVWPSPFGPRQLGQLAASVDVEQATSTASARQRRQNMFF